MKLIKGFKHREWQSACKLNRNIYVFGGITPFMDCYAGKLMLINIDECTLHIQESINKIPIRWAHSCCAYSIFYYLLYSNRRKNLYDRWI